MAQGFRGSRTLRWRRALLPAALGMTSLAQAPVTGTEALGGGRSALSRGGAAADAAACAGCGGDELAGGWDGWGDPDCSRGEWTALCGELGAGGSAGG
jgi:hypothetical protein